MGHGRNTAPAEPGSQALGWYAGRARSGLDWIPAHTWRHVHGSQDHALFTELRAELLHDGDSDDESARFHAAVPGQSSERPDLSELRAQDRCGWQRYRGDPSS